MQRTATAEKSMRMARVSTMKVRLPGAVRALMGSAVLALMGSVALALMGSLALALMGSAELAVAAQNTTERTPGGRGQLAVADEVLNIEVARTAAQRSRGLMERDSLAEDAGMLFVYPEEQPATSAYWMYRTRIALDIAFVDSRGVIRSLRTMSPCRATQSSQCPVYPAGAPFRAALEANAGYFERHGISEGDRVDLAPWLASP